MDKTDVVKAEKTAQIRKRAIDDLVKLAKKEGGKSLALAMEVSQLAKLDPLDPKTEGTIQKFINKFSK